MKKRSKILRTLVFGIFTAALISPALSTVAKADPPSRGHAYGQWKKFDNHRAVRKRFHRKKHWRQSRRHHRRHFRPRYTIREVSTRDNSRHVERDLFSGLIGAIIGGGLGGSMDRNDQFRVNQALETSPTGAPIVWRNAETGGAYTVTPTKTYQVANNSYCREFTTWGFIGGYEEKIYGTACRQPDGSWAPVK